jgi:outer membrane lipoprotein-sorting protein
MISTRLQNRGAATLAALFCALSVAGLLASATVPAVAQRANGSENRGPDPRRLLRRMIEAETKRAISGREVTFIAGGLQSEQLIKRDPKRGLRMEYVNPPGTVFVDNFKRSWLLSPREKRLEERKSRLGAASRKAGEVLRLIERRQLRAEWVGQDVVAGRDADIVQVSPAEDTPAPYRRFWIDRETGLKLRVETRGPQGRIHSSSYFLSVNFRPKLTKNDFAPLKAPRDAFIVRENNELFSSLGEAQKRVQFSLREPKYLPTRFALREVLARDFRGAKVVVQRYTNGLNALSLSQTDADLPHHGVKPGGRTLRVLTWRDKNLSFALVGDLPEDQLRRIKESVR